MKNKENVRSSVTPFAPEERLSLSDLDKQLGRDLSSLSQAVSRLLKRMETNPSPAGAFARVRQDEAEIPISQA